MKVRKKSMVPLKAVETKRCSGVAVVARRIGCHPVQLSYIMHGRRKASDKLRRRLARMGITCTVDGKDL